MEMLYWETGSAASSVELQQTTKQPEQVPNPPKPQQLGLNAKT